ncbi:copper transporter [Streptosporangium sp. NPDC087985]|uniref:copper transporter n=1 Tax=Streptosporangium sp. NPDC087985 TaxID=3366196 RepID=UPI00382B96C3
MIDFRYHLVSIVAIFLALSVGIVLGTSFLEDPAIKTAQALAERLSKGNDELRGQIESLQKREAGTDALIAAATPRLVQDALATERVVIVEAPGATAGMREAVQEVIAKSGATVTGRVVLADTYVDATQSAAIDKLATDAKPAEMTFVPDATPYEKTAAVLASAIMTSDPGQLGKENPVAAGVLDAFENGGLLTVSGQPAKRADLAVLVAPAEPYTGENAVQQAGAITAMAVGLDDAGRGAVLAGALPAAATGGVIAALREDTAAAEKVSTVDTADMPAGRVVVVYALREQLFGVAGQYGLGSGASGIEPSAPPTPAPVPTATSGG